MLDLCTMSMNLLLNSNDLKVISPTEINEDAVWTSIPRKRYFMRSDDSLADLNIVGRTENTHLTW